MAGSSILIGVSGGPDSLYLLDILRQLNYALIVATFNHLLRPQAVAEVEQVRHFCEKKQIAFVTGQGDAHQYAQENGLSLEEAARTIRYGFLFQQAQLCKAEAVAVGHTADDQVETILMHLIRGSGPTGLSGMRYRSLPNPWSTTIPIVRPLLSTWRSEIEQYVTRHELPASQDQSNLDKRFFRNRLRHELIPQLETYNPNIRTALWKTAQVLAEEQAVLESAMEVAWQTCVDDKQQAVIQFQVTQFNQQPIAIQRGLLRKAIGNLIPGLRDIDFEAIERARAFIQSPSRSHRIDLIAGLIMHYEQGQVWLGRQEAEFPTPDWPQLTLAAQGHLTIPGELLLSPHWKLQASFRELDQNTRQEAIKNPDPYQAWLDADQIAAPLIVRSRKPGDRFRPLGLIGGSMKLSDFFVNHKLPRRARDHWPILCSGQEICWVPGFQSSDAFRLTEQSRRSVHLSLVRISAKIIKKI